jgi:hypothetical protein
MDYFVDRIFVWWSTFDLLTGALVFFAYLALDMLYAHYTFAITKLRSARAATTGAIMYFLLAIGILNYTDNPLYLIPLVFGSWVGTYVTVESERRKMLE